MEEMLQNFTNLGMGDVAFLIVNSKQERSQQMLPALESRVTFPVYQETSEEEVWNVLEGGKDDMFVYDRCNRLVAHIPFPLSILDRPLVSDFILFAYHKDPCKGTPCKETESNTTVEDIGNQNYTTYFLNGTENGNYEQGNSSSRRNEIFPGSDVNETFSSSNETADSRTNNTFHLEHHSSGNISHSKMTDHNALQIFYDSIEGLNTLDISNATDINFNTFNIPIPSLGQNSENKTICYDTDNCQEHKPLHTKDIHELTSKVTMQPNAKRICIAEDEKVCKQWNKRQLKRIVKCCAPIDGISEDGGNKRDTNICKSFQKKRCKKLRTIIKCCLKIHASREDDENSDETHSSEKQKITDAPHSKLLHDHADEHGAENSMERVP